MHAYIDRLVTELHYMLNGFIIVFRYDLFDTNKHGTRCAGQVCRMRARALIMCIVRVKNVNVCFKKGELSMKMVREVKRNNECRTKAVLYFMFWKQIWEEDKNSLANYVTIIIDR